MDLKEDGSLCIGENVDQLIYHPTLNLLICLSEDKQIRIYDASSFLLQTNITLRDVELEKLKINYIESQNRILMSNGKLFGLRRELNGILYLSTIMQPPVELSDSEIYLEITLNEANQMVSLLSNFEQQYSGLLQHINTLLKNISHSIKADHKLKWQMIEIKQPLSSLLTSFTNLLANAKLQARPEFPLLSALADRVAYLSQSSYNFSNLTDMSGTLDRALMHNEAIRRFTFNKWPHPDYKWALPEPMAQAGFYYHPNNNGNSVDDRAMCFTCNVCLVYWEATDEPWSEHERHSPQCPFVKGEFTRNVLISVTYATEPARSHNIDSPQKIECISTTTSSNFIASITLDGNIIIWNNESIDKKHMILDIDLMSPIIVKQLHHENLNIDCNEKYIRPNAFDYTYKLQCTSSCILSASCHLKHPTTIQISGPSKLHSIIVGANVIESRCDFGKTLVADNEINEIIHNKKDKANENILDYDLGKQFLVNDEDEKVKNECFVLLADYLLDDMEMYESTVNLTSSGHISNPVTLNTTNKIYQNINLLKPKNKDSNKIEVDSEINTEDGYAYVCLFVYKIAEQVQENAAIQIWKEYENLDPDNKDPKDIASSNANIEESCPIDISYDGSLFAENIDKVYSTNNNAVPALAAIYNDNKLNKEPLQCIVLAKGKANQNYLVTNIHPLPDNQHILVIVATQDKCLLFILKSTIFVNSILLCDTVVSRYDINDDVVTSICFAPLDQQSSDDEMDSLESKNLNVCEHVLVCVMKSGRIQIFSLINLTMIFSMGGLDDDLFISAAYCHGNDRLCFSTSKGFLKFFKLLRLIDSSDDQVDSTSSTKNKFFKDESLLTNQKLNVTTLTQLHKLTQFENLLPRFTSSCPSSWMEVQQEQQQRKHPQHLHQRGEAAQHTRTWRIQTDGCVNDDHIFEIVLPKSTFVGHIDVKFSLGSMCSSVPHVYVTLLSPVKQEVTELTVGVDDKVDFHILAVEETIEKYSEILAKKYKTEVICGPIDIADCLDLSGTQGIITLTSTKLISEKNRSFLLHVKSVSSSNIKMTLNNESGRKFSNTTLDDNQLDSSKKSLRKNSLSTYTKAFSVDNINKVIPIWPTMPTIMKSDKKPSKSSEWIQELSVTIRKFQRVQMSVHNERLNRTSMITSRVFFTNLILSALGIDDLNGDPVLARYHRRHLAFDILMWIAMTQVNDYNAYSRSKWPHILCVVEDHIENLVELCLISSDRTISYKCAKLLALGIGQDKILSSFNCDFNNHLLKSLVDLLPNIFLSTSPASLHHFFLLLNNLKSSNPNLVAEKLTSLLVKVSASYSCRLDSLHSILRSQYGLYGTPLEPFTFDLDPPPLKPIIGSLPQTSVPAADKFLSGMGGLTSWGFNDYSASAATSTTMNNKVNVVVDEDNLSDLMCMLIETESKGNKSDQLSRYLSGLIEVEPLHFTCHSISDGMIMERMDTYNTVTSTSNVSAAPITGTINFNFGPNEMLPPSGQSAATASGQLLTADQQLQQLHQKQMMLMKLQMQKQKLEQKLAETSKVMMNHPSSQFYSTTEHLPPPTPKNTPFFMTPPITPPNEVLQNLYNNLEAKIIKENQTADTESNNATKPEKLQTKMPIQWQQNHGLFQLPPQQALVIDRVHPGGRRFVVLDFGKLIQLSDIIIPSFCELASLSIDLWCEDEEVDGWRLLVSSDISTSCIVMNNILPPPICRYLKITTLKRYGSNSSKNRIPIGSFYGHTFIFPWDHPASHQTPHLVYNSTSNQNIGQQISSNSSFGDQFSFNHRMDSAKKSSNQTQQLQANQVVGMFGPNAMAIISNQLSIYMALYEECLCKYNLVCHNLIRLLKLSSGFGSSRMIRLHIKESFRSEEDQKIILVYHEAMQLQAQLNLAREAISRLKNILNPSTTKHKSTACEIIGNLSTLPLDKIRIITELIVSSLLSMTSLTFPIAQTPFALVRGFNAEIVEEIFNSLCVCGSRRMQVECGVLLVRVCASQTWWGNFLAKMFDKYFSANQMFVFPQDRLFMLILMLSQRSSGIASSSTAILESIFSLLINHIKPLLRTTDSGVAEAAIGHLDVNLIGWLLLYLSKILDTSSIYIGEENEKLYGYATAKDKDDNKWSKPLSNRWGFINGDTVMQSSTLSKNRLALKVYRRKMHKRLLQPKPAIIKLPTINVTATNQNMNANKKLSADNWDGEIGDALIFVPRNLCVKLAEHLVAFLLSLNFNNQPDLSILTCKVLARIMTGSKSGISLPEAMSQSNLEKILSILCSSNTNSNSNENGSSLGSPWLTHVLICLFQDILESELVHSNSNFDVLDSVDSAIRVGNSFMDDASQYDVQDFTNIDDQINMKEEDILFVGKMEAEMSMLVDTLIDEGSYDINQINLLKDEWPPLLSVAAAAAIPLQSDAKKQLKAYMDCSALKKSPNKSLKSIENNCQNYMPITRDSNKGILKSLCVLGVSPALDTRLELGLDAYPENQLKVMSAMELMNIQKAMSSPICPITNQDLFQPNRETTPKHDSMQTISMLSSCFKHLFVQLKNDCGLNLESLLNVWLTLNDDQRISSESSTNFDPTVIPIISVDDDSIASLINYLATASLISNSEWVLSLEALSLMSNMRNVTVAADWSTGLNLSSIEVKGKDLSIHTGLPTMVKRLLTGCNSSELMTQDGKAGPTLVRALHNFIYRIIQNSDIQHLKTIFLSTIYELSLPGGAFYQNIGPIDVQCQFLTDISLGCVIDVNVALKCIEAISQLAVLHFSQREKVTSKSSIEINGTDPRMCFTTFFSGILKDAQIKNQNNDISRDMLITHLLIILKQLLLIPMNSNNFEIEVTKSESSLKEELASQLATDEQKTAAEASHAPFTTPCSHSIKETCSYLMDYVLENRQHIVIELLTCLSHCHSHPTAMVIGSRRIPIDLILNLLTGEPATLGDCIFIVLGTINSKASNLERLVEVVVQFLQGLGERGRKLPEPLLWWLLLLLDCKITLKKFIHLGGIELICGELVGCKDKALNEPASFISPIIQSFGSVILGKTKQNSNQDGQDLQNFAPFGQISSVSPLANSAHILLQETPPPRRARSAAWNYLFYPEEPWVDLTITLPCAILLKEVIIMPHNCLASCPAAIAIECSRDGSSFVPLCRPISTSGLSNIKIVLTNEEVISTVTIRLHRPRDSQSLGLSQIMLMGRHAFNVNSSKSFSNSSIDWLRLLHHCMSCIDVQQDVTEHTSQIHSLVPACVNLLAHPHAYLHSNSIENVLHNICVASLPSALQLIKELIGFQDLEIDGELCGSGIMKSKWNESSVNILHDLITHHDSNQLQRIEALTSWLDTQAAVQNSNTIITESGLKKLNPMPGAGHVHCIAVDLWSTFTLSKLLRPRLVQLANGDLLLNMYNWSSSLPIFANLRKSIDCVIASLCYIRPANFDILLNYISNQDNTRELGNFVRRPYENIENAMLTDDNKADIKDLDKILVERLWLQMSASTLATLSMACRSYTCMRRIQEIGLLSAMCHALESFADSNFITEADLDVDSDYEDAVATSSTSWTQNLSVDINLVGPLLNFLTEISHEGSIKDWLGGPEGSIFWAPLIKYLCSNTVNQIENGKNTLSCKMRFIIESAAIDFFNKVISCHQNNQQQFSLIFNEVIQSTTAHNNGTATLPSFLRSLLLQVLLEDEKVIVLVSSQHSMFIRHQSSMSFQHPRLGTGYRHKQLLLSLHSTIADVIDCVSATGNLSKNQIGSNDSSQYALFHDSIKYCALPNDMTLSQLLSVLRGVVKNSGETYLTLKLGSNINCLADLNNELNIHTPSGLLNSEPSSSVLQIFSSIGGLALLAEHLPLLYPEFVRYSPPSVTAQNQKDPNVAVSHEWVTIESGEEYYEEFVENYPMASSPLPQTKSGLLGANSVQLLSIPPHSLVAFGLFLRLPGYSEVLLRDWRKAQCLLRLVLGVVDDGRGGHILSSPIAASLPSLPFHVLKMLFDNSPLTTDDGVVLRRVAMDIGVIHLILACLSVLGHHAPRQTMSGFYNDLIQSTMQMTHEPAPAPTQTAQRAPTDEKGQSYWAKGTGFGTGSTTSNWDAEHALLRQKSEEHHVTSLLQVLGSYINPSGSKSLTSYVDEFVDASEHLVNDFEQKDLLPQTLPIILRQSCLIPALSSYLRNDSVLDMAYHVPLYRAIFEVLRGIASCPSLVGLLLPLGDDSTPINMLLDGMKKCVDTYANRLKSKKPKNGVNEDDDTEGLSLLIPDIQNTDMLVENAIQKHFSNLECFETVNVNKSSIMVDGFTRMNQTESDRYISIMKVLQFDTWRIAEDTNGELKFLVPYHYESNVKSLGDVSSVARARRLAQEAVTLSTSLPLSSSSCVFVRCDEDRLDIMKVLMTGPSDTPYSNGCFEFDVCFPSDYPNFPPLINLETTGSHTVRFNPNLYNDGKVCLSILNTWHGRPEEKWNAQTSSFLQVLVSIQSLILVQEPYFNEPGYERSRGTPSGMASSKEYDANIMQATVKWAMLEMIKNPPEAFKEVILWHFWLKKSEIMSQVEAWITDLEENSRDKRVGRNIAHSCMALKRNYKLLKEELANLKEPKTKQ